MAVTLEMSVQEVATGSKARLRVLDGYGIDTCCGGKVSLRKACTNRGLDPDAVLKALVAADDPSPEPPADDLSALSLQALTDHLVELHHRYLREHLPRLVQLAHKVARVHGPHRQELVELAQVVDRFSREMIAHLDKEEQVLFPFIRQLERAPEALGRPPQFVAQPIRVMLMEHDDATRDLERMRALSDGYRVPADACSSYRALFEGLAAMDADTVTHMQKEGEGLFPRAMDLAQVGR